jgi:hypothetical protein
LQELIDLSKQLLAKKNQQRSIYDEINTYEPQDKKSPAYKELIETQENNANNITEQEDQLLHILSDIIDFDSNSLEDPGHDLGTLLSIKLTAYQTNKYRTGYARQLQSQLNISALSIEQIAFVQEFSYLANHAGYPLNDTYRNELINYYQQKLEQDPNYTMTELHNEPELQHIYNYINTIPPNKDIPSASLWSILTVLSIV